MARWKSAGEARPAAPQLANTGAYLFARVFELEIGLSPRGGIRDHRLRQPARGETAFHVVRSTFWYPIGTEETWTALGKWILESVDAR